MATCVTSWEDEENNRIVELQVEYELDGSQVAVQSVTPSAVQFLDPATQAPIRKIGVHTEAGQRHLLKKYRDHAGYEHLTAQLDARLLASAE